jgi:hypothetical protein
LTFNVFHNPGVGRFVKNETREPAMWVENFKCPLSRRTHGDYLNAELPNLLGGDLPEGTYDFTSTTI